MAYSELYAAWGRMLACMPLQSRRVSSSSQRQARLASHSSAPCWLPAAGACLPTNQWQQQLPACHMYRLPATCTACLPMLPMYQLCAAAARPVYRTKCSPLHTTPTMLLRIPRLGPDSVDLPAAPMPPISCALHRHGGAAAAARPVCRTGCTPSHPTSTHPTKGRVD